MALNCGFSSSANFSKAVKLYFGFSPSEIRNPGKSRNSKIGKITSKYGKAFNPSDLYPTRIGNDVTCKTYLEDNNMKVKVKEIDGYRVCALPSNGGYEHKSIYEA